MRTQTNGNEDITDAAEFRLGSIDCAAEQLSQASMEEIKDFQRQELIRAVTGNKIAEYHEKAHAAVNGGNCRHAIFQIGEDPVYKEFLDTDSFHRFCSHFSSEYIGAYHWRPTDNA